MQISADAAYGVLRVSLRACWRLYCACPGCPGQPNTGIACRGTEATECRSLLSTSSQGTV